MDFVMNCTQCKREKNIKDFFKSTICYACTFKNKLKIFEETHKIQPKIISKIHLCKICNKEYEKKRSIYCSKECIAISKKKFNENYWIKKIKVPTLKRNLPYGKHKSL